MHDSRRRHQVAVHRVNGMAEGSNSKEPVFKQLLGERWNELGPVIREHYFLRPYSADAVSVDGIMLEVKHSRVAKLLLPMFQFFGALVPYAGVNVPVVVHYRCQPTERRIYWRRVFRFPKRAEFHFRSYMEPVANGEMIEFVRFGVGMRLAVTAEAGALVFRDKGYVWRIGSLLVPLPLGWLLGSAYIEERPISDTEFSMQMTLTHPWFGELFQYRGRFVLPG